MKKALRKQCFFQLNPSATGEIRLHGEGGDFPDTVLPHILSYNEIAERILLTSAFIYAITNTRGDNNAGREKI